MKKLSLGLGVGFLLGYFLRPTITKERISPEKALKKAKATASSQHTISGSWIHMNPETVERYGLQYEIYRGGISTSTPDGTIQYDFISETKNGTLLELTQS
ncbi:hypothetical protein [Alkalicoccobacillus murimartini]|uniref:Small secreted protein n=1 Tax=Alkalicoccobacillus murimartini TaxID=171685 RepID=A0ABT9YLU9_9BACI|nr:hypothetical protein [Alkalicoccobacillus murimartini]MDQ0208167.1 putative small secreted protein [Alkalicoccobacillus murimartini]